MKLQVRVPGTDLYDACKLNAAVVDALADRAVLAPQPRYLLPSDLAGALKRLDDAEIDTLLAAVTTEAERRGRRAPRSATERPPSAVPSFARIASASSN